MHLGTPRPVPRGTEMIIGLACWFPGWKRIPWVQTKPWLLRCLCSGRERMGPLSYRQVLCLLKCGLGQGVRGGRLYLYLSLHILCTYIRIT